MLAEYYLTLKALHILSMMAWIAGLLYLPRLFVYHMDFEVGSKGYETFCTMERKTLKIVLLPAILLTFTFGILLAFATHVWSAPWFHMKLMLVLGLAGLHGFFSRLAKNFARGKAPSLSKNALRLISEVPFLLSIFIVFLAVVKFF